MTSTPTPAAPLSADARQVGGAHYKGEQMQHWNYAARARLGYFEGQITKYLDRHKRKHGLQDVEKALHFSEKLMELRNAGQRDMHEGFSTALWAEFTEGRNLSDDEHEAMYLISKWTTRAELGRVIDAIKRIKETYAAADAQPQGYVDQDRTPVQLSSEQQAAVDEQAGLAP